MVKNYFLWLWIFFCCVTLDARPRRRFSRFKRQRTIQQKPVKPAKPLRKKPFLLKEAINTIVSKAGKKAATGIKVVSLRNNACIYEKDADTVFIPASNTKLITAAAAYHILGADFVFKTKLLTDSISYSRINNLYIKGSGDPSLTTKDLELLVHALKSRQIREIKGDLIIDASIFDGVAIAPGASRHDGPIFDKSPTCGLTVNHSCISVFVKPGRSLRRRPLVYTDPFTSMPIENNALTTSLAKKHGLHVSRKKDNTLTVSGSICINHSCKSYRIAVEQPHLYCAHTLITVLKQHKILFRGRIIVGKIPVDAKEIASHSSENLNQLIRFMMKSSDNLYADSFFKKMGELKYGAPGTFAKGKKVVEGFLAKDVKLSLEKVCINDGSGLSHLNKISPNALIECLTWMYKSQFKNLFIDSLPISGIDGSLRRRMKHKITHSKVKAKTGNLPGITALSGYITPLRATENPLAFVIIVNRKNQSVVHYKRQLEDELCHLLAAHAFST